MKDVSGAALSGTTVTALNQGTGVSTTVHANESGDYVLTPLKIGSYSLSVEAQGFEREMRNGLVLSVQQHIRLDFSLKVGSVTQQTVVSGAAPLVETDTASLGDVITGRQVRELPLNGRRYTDLATLTAGVAKVLEGPVNGSATPTNGNAGGGFSVNGTHGDQNDFILDGVDNTSNDNGDLAFTTSVDAIAEFKVQTSNYSAEFGRSGSAIVADSHAIKDLLQKVFGGSVDDLLLSLVQSKHLDAKKLAEIQAKLARDAEEEEAAE